MKNSLLVLVLLCSTLSSFAQKTLFKNGYLHIGNGSVISSAAVGVEGDKIILVKNSLAYSYSVSDWDTIIDLKGAHIYPGFIAANSTLGLTEIDAVHASNDFEEFGKYNPHVRAQVAFNVESEVIRTVRSNGVLLAQATPRGHRITGTSTVFVLDGWNWEDATALADDGIHVNWPSSIKRSRDNRRVQEANDTYQKEKDELISFFTSAKVYAANKKGERDLRFSAMSGIFNGTKRVYFRADGLQEINDIIDFCLQFQIKTGVIVGGYESPLVARKLKDAKISVMLMRPHSLPLRDDDPVYRPYALAAQLQSEGVLYCIQNEGDMEAMNARNLPFLAGTAQAYGLTEEEAVASISLNTAKILGCDQQYGSIEVGKKATLFISEGNALDMRTNNVICAMINGKWVNLGNRQSDLYQKYRTKYQQQPDSKKKK